MFRPVFCLILGSLMLAGCSSVVVRDNVPCAQIDWWEAGRTDGVIGLPLTKSLQETAKRCEGHPIDLEVFENGHEAGLIDFCTPSQGLALGRSGRPYDHACPETLEQAFMKAYDIGLQQRAFEAQQQAQSHDANSATL